MISEKSWALSKSILVKILEILKSSVGYYSENQVYGNLHILNEYCGVPIGTRIIGRLEHSPYLSHVNSHKAISSSNSSTYKNNLSDTYVWLKRDEDSAKHMGWNNFKAIGAPWLYLLALKKSHGFDYLIPHSDRNIDELWIFANHSVDKFQGGITKELRAFLVAVRQSKADSKLVALFYTDYFSLSKQNREEFSDLKIVTLLGSRLKSSSANAHLYTLFHLLSNVKCLTLDFPSTMMLYAMTLNCDIKWFKNVSYEMVKKEAIEIGSYDLVEVLTAKELTKEFKSKFAEKELGRDSLKTPQELRTIFGWTESGLIARVAAARMLRCLLLAPFRYLNRER